MGVTQRWGIDHSSLVNQEQILFQEKDKESSWDIKSLLAIAVTTDSDGLI